MVTVARGQDVSQFGSGKNDWSNLQGVDQIILTVDTHSAGPGIAELDAKEAETRAAITKSLRDQLAGAGIMVKDVSDSVSGLTSALSVLMDVACSGGQCASHLSLRLFRSVVLLTSASDILNPKDSNLRILPVWSRERFGIGQVKVYPLSINYTPLLTNSPST
jgi:hypothetical protein